MKFNEKLKTLRESKGLTQEEVANSLHIARQSVSKWEQGINEPDLATVKKLCLILDCSLEELVDDDQEIITSKQEKAERLSQKLFFYNLALLIVCFFGLLAFLPAAGESILIPGGSDGMNLGPKWWLLCSLIPIASMMGILFLFRIWFKKKSSRRYQLQWQIAAIIVSMVLSGSMFGVAIWMVKDHMVSPSPLVGLLIGEACSLILGVSFLSHPRFTGRNALLGFRTNFTLSSNEAWNKVNSFASIALGISASLAYILALCFMQASWVFCVMLALLLGVIPSVIYHEVLRHKKK